MVPSTTLLEMPLEEQAQMHAILRRARYGSLLAFHIILLCAAGRNLTEIAAFLFGSRSSVYRIVHAYRTGSLGVRVDPEGQLSVAVQTSLLMPWLTHSLGVVLKAAPRAYDWCRTRWSYATLAATLQAKDDEPKRIDRLARRRFHYENFQAYEVVVFADELDIPLLPKVGAAWMLQGPQEAIRTPGTNEKHDLAGVLHPVNCCMASARAKTMDCFVGTPEVTAAVKNIAGEQQSKVAA